MNVYVLSCLIHWNCQLTLFFHCKGGNITLLYILKNEYVTGIEPEKQYLIEDFHNNAEFQVSECVACQDC